MFNSPWREMMYNDNSYPQHYDRRDAASYNTQMDSSGMTDSDSGRDSGVAPNALPHPDDVMTPYDQRAVTSPSSIYSENNYAEIPGQDSLVRPSPYLHSHPAIRYVPDLPGNYVFNENRRSPDFQRDLPATHRHHDLPATGSQGSPDSGVGFYPIQRTGALPLTNNHVPTSNTLPALPQTTLPLTSTTLTEPNTHCSTLNGFPGKTLDIATVCTVPLPDRRSRAVAECDFYQRKPQNPNKRRKSILMHVVAMAVVGVLYLAIGITAGYFIGKGACQDCEIAPCPTSLPDLPTTSNLTNATTTATTAESTTITTIPTTTTTQIPETTEAPSNCVNVQGVCRCGPFGGNAEREFDDRDIYLQNGNITSFVVNHNEYFIGSIQFWYGKTAGPQHGYTTSGYEVKVDLAHNEIITDVHVDFTSGKPFLTRLQINTNLRVFGPYGGRAGEQMATQGGRLLYIAGRAGAMIDQLSLYFNRCTS